MFQILFLTDFSENANIALRYACDLVKDKSGKITMVNSYSRGDNQNSEAVLQRLKKYRDACPDIKMDFKVNEDSAIEDISKLLKTGKYNLLVMAFNEDVANKNSQIGKLTSDMIRNVRQTILAIPEHAKYKPVKKIAYALDYVDFKADKLKMLNAIAERLGAEIILLHVSEVENYIEEEKLKNYRVAMDSVVDYDNLSFDFIGDPDVNKALEEYVESKNIDALAMLTRDYHLIEKAYEKSLTKNMLFQCKIPLVVFHE